MKKNKITISILVAVIFIVATLILISHLAGLGGGYQHSGSRSDDYRILKNGETIIKGTIVDYKKISNFVIGLRLPAKYFECDNGGGYKIVLKNQKEYFVLNTSSDAFWNYSSKEDFDAKLEELSIKSNDTLDYSKFEYTWKTHSNYYKNIDYSTCKSLSSRP